MKADSTKKKIAFIHRYGLEGWFCCGGHAIPGVIKELSREAEIHFFGPNSTEHINKDVRENIIAHRLPYTWNRSNPRDKITKTLIWYFFLPWIGLRCRFMKVDLIWNDETVPLTALILRIFYGRKVAITVMDFFMRIYTENHPSLKWLRKAVEWIDFATWKKLPLIFTKVLYTQEFLEKQGVPREIMHLYRNPVNHEIFHPIAEDERREARKKLGFTDDDIVLSHHGILHPNKGNDWIMKRLAELKDELPHLKYLLIGNGPEMDNLKKLTDDLDLTGRVIFTGWLPDEKSLNRALCAADIGLVMRIGQETDNFHMTDTLVHEMACGKPVLAINLKGIVEILNVPLSQYTFSIEDPSKFNEILTILATSSATRKILSKNSLTISHKTCETGFWAKLICRHLKSASNI